MISSEAVGVIYLLLNLYDKNNRPKKKKKARQETIRKDEEMDDNTRPGQSVTLAVQTESIQNKYR